MCFLKKSFHSQSHLCRQLRWFKLLSLWVKSYGVTIQMKPLQQYFHVVLIYITIFYKILGFVLNFDFRHSWE